MNTGRPQTIVLKLSKLCNLRCTYCYEFPQLADKARMPLAGLERLFAGLAAAPCTSQDEAPLQFALHGGEPTLLPPAYLRELVALQERHLGAAGITYRNTIQTNLYAVKPQTLDLLQELGIQISVSLDVFGDQRVTGSGQDVEPRIQENLDRLLADPSRRDLVNGGITVLYRHNAERITEIFDFFHQRGLDFRVLPMFHLDEHSSTAPQLCLTPAELLQRLQELAIHWLSQSETRIKVYPLQEYLSAAILHLEGRKLDPFIPGEQEWALLIDTHGEVYSHGDAYLPGFSFGNAFAQDYGELMSSAARQHSVIVRSTRGETCKGCGYQNSCPRLPVVEALPSERQSSDDGRLHCNVAQPMTAFFEDLVRALRPNGTQAANAAHPNE